MIAHLYDLVRQRAERFPTAPALGGQQGLGWRTLDSGELLARTDQLAGELERLGVAEGDRVVLWLPNHWQTPIYLFALWKLGAVAIPFDREMNPEAAARILASVEPRLVLSGYSERPAWAVGHAVTEWWEPGERDTGATPAEPWRRPTEELATIVFTSGTTGTPKGCMITHGNLCSQLEALPACIPLDTTCRMASILPLSHLFELTSGLLFPLHSGAAIHYLPSRRGTDILRVLQEQRITHMLAVPQLLALMGRTMDDQLRAKLPAVLYRGLNATAARLPLEGRRRLFWMIHRQLGGGLRVLVSGGAALPPETQLLWERLGVRVVQGYGASECSPVIAAGTLAGTAPGSVGKAIPGVSVRLSGEGELLVHGPNVMQGYWQDPDRTAEVLRDGWYATGDLATIDADGSIRLVGRAKDLIVLPSGMNVWPQDVEDALRAEPAIKDAVVLAVPSASGATLHAYLLAQHPADRAADPAPLVARCNGRLAQHQRLASASWWSDADFPRTALGKVRRTVLPMPDAQASVAVDSVLAADDPVGQAVAGVAHIPTVADNQELGGLGLDSMGLVELAQALEEKTGKHVGDGDVRLDMTVAQVRSLLAGAPSLEAATSNGKASKWSGAVPLWPYRWGRAFRALDFPIDLLYRYAVTRTIVLGGEHLEALGPRVIFAGTHHSFADMPLVQKALRQTAARRLAGRLVIATAADGFARGGLAARYGVLGLGLYPLHQHDEREASLRGLANLAEAGHAVLIFPQGTHATPEQERSGLPSACFRPGVAHLAGALEAMVVPFGLAGTERTMPAHLENFQGKVVAGIPISLTRGPLAIDFGAPITLARGEDPHAFAARLQEACFALTREAEATLAHP